MKWMFETLKAQNSNWNCTRVVMADKDINERDIIKAALPNASVLICLFHTFRRELTCERMGITSGQRSTCLEMVQQLAYSTTEEKYAELYIQFKGSCSKKVVDYYDGNWHQIKDEWVLGFKADSGSFLNMTNNRLESINGKLKQVISRNSSLEDFVVNFFIILTCLRTERDHKAALCVKRSKFNRIIKAHLNMITLYFSHHMLLNSFLSNSNSRIL